jgi:hypothetical protein
LQNNYQPHQQNVDDVVSELYGQWSAKKPLTKKTILVPWIHKDPIKIHNSKVEPNYLRRDKQMIEYMYRDDKLNKVKIPIRHIRYV